MFNAIQLKVLAEYIDDGWYQVESTFPDMSNGPCVHIKKENSHSRIFPDGKVIRMPFEHSGMLNEFMNGLAGLAQ